MKEDENNNTANNNPPQGQGGAFLVGGEPGRETLDARTSARFLKAISTDLIPTKEGGMTDRDRKLLEILDKADKKINLKRRNKSVVLSPPENIITLVLGDCIGVLRADKDIADAISDPTGASPIRRVIDVKELTKYIYKNTRKVDTVEERLRNISSTFQFFKIDWKGKNGEELHYQQVIPIISLINDASLKIKGIEGVEDTEQSLMIVEFSRAYFIDLDKHYSRTTDKLIETYNAGGRKSALFSYLLDSILGVQWQFFAAAKGERDKLHKRNKTLPKGERLTNEQIEELVEEKKLLYKPSFATIKERVPTDYSSEKQYRANFKTDLDKAIDDLVRMELITEKSMYEENDNKDDGYGIVKLYINENYKKEISTLDARKILLPYKPKKVEEKE